MQDQQEPTKKAYEAPKVTDYGTLKEQTAGGFGTPTPDGTTGSS